MHNTAKQSQEMLVPSATPKTEQIHRTKRAVREVATAHSIHAPTPISISSQEFDILLATIQQASSSFVTAAENDITNRAQKLFTTATPSPQQQIKTVFSHRDLGRTKANILEDRKAMAMIDRALDSDSSEIHLFCTGFPMKVFNPLETNYRGDLVDLGDISTLLRFAELAKILTHFGRPLGKRFSVTIISDGEMNAGMFKADPHICDSYVANLKRTVTQLDIASFVSVQEFYSLLAPHKNKDCEYRQLTHDIKTDCHAAFDHLLRQNSLQQSIQSAITQEQRKYGSLSFEQLFNSTIGSARYEEIEQFCKKFNLDFLKSYAMILESILWDEKIELTQTCHNILEGLPNQAKIALVEALQQLRSVVMRKAWHSTIEYFAGLEVNRKTNILDTLFPDGIRVTTRPKEGQIGVHTSDQSAPTLFSYHSVPVIVPCNKGRNVKIDFQLRFHTIQSGYRPVLRDNDDVVCYIHPDLSLPIEQLPWKRGSK